MQEEDFAKATAQNAEELAELGKIFFETGHTPLFYAANPTTILYGKLGEEPVPVKLEDFEKQVGITWTNSPVTGIVARDELFTDLTITRSVLPLTCEILSQPFNDFAILETNESAGKGVFYWPPKHKAREVLKQGTPTGLYSGSLCSAGLEGGFFDYGFLIDAPEVLDSAFTKAGFGYAFINAQHFRNAAPFMNHAPSEEKLAAIPNLPQALRQYAVTANIGFSPSKQLGIPTLFGRTLRDIQPKEQLLIDYGDYGNKPYQLFDITGHIIGTVNSENQFEANPNYLPCEILAPRCSAKADDEVDEITVQLGLSAKDSLTDNLVTNMAFAIKLFQNRKPPGSEELFKEMAACCNSNNNPSLANQALHKIVVIDKRLDNFPTLRPLYGELCIHFSQIDNPLKQLKTLEGRFNKRTGKEWTMTYDAQSRMGLCIFGKRTLLREYKKEISWIPAFILQINNKDALVVYFSALLAHQQQLAEEQPAAKISGNKKTTGPKKKK